MKVTIDVVLEENVQPQDRGIHIQHTFEDFKLAEFWLSRVRDLVESWGLFVPTYTQLMTFVSLAEKAWYTGTLVKSRYGKPDSEFHALYKAQRTA
jgi:hypothetical protein